MTKTKSIILCLVILIAIFSGCSKQETISKSELQTSTTNAITNEITAKSKKHQNLKLPRRKAIIQKQLLQTKQNPLSKNQQVRTQQKK